MEEGYPPKSIFQQTEEQIAAEEAERVDGAIQTWMDKLVVDDPVFHVDLRVADRPAQHDRVKGILQDPAKKKSIRGLYRGRNTLSFGDNSYSEPSAFVHESTIDEISKFESTLRPHEPRKWSGADCPTDKFVLDRNAHAEGPFSN